MAILRRCVALLLIAVLAACGAGGPAFQASDISGSSFGRDFELKDPQGRTRTLADFRGKAVVLFFGYTQCPDVCPTTLTTMGEVMRRLGPEADRVQVLFVTVDPERDTQALLANYVPAFDARFLGLRGSLDETAAVAKDFRTFYQKSGDTSGPNYTIDHAAGTYIFDPQGRVRLYVKHGETAENITADIRVLLAGS